jgi:hypothetical protein
MRREKTQISEIRNKKREITTNTKEIQDNNKHQGKPRNHWGLL